MRARGALLAALILVQAVPAGAAPQILLRSGDAAEGEASPIPGASYGSFNGRDDVSINDGQLAFVAALAGSAAAGLFVRDLAGGVTTPLAKVGDLVGAEALTDIRSGFVGLNSLGEVAFLGVFASGVK